VEAKTDALPVLRGSAMVNASTAAFTTAPASNG